MGEVINELIFMSTSKHTPGPWRLDEYGHVVYGQKSENLLLSGVSLPCGNHPLAQEAKANTRLLVAAPELLAACIKASQWIEAGMPVTTQNVHADLDAAIAKATA